MSTVRRPRVSHEPQETAVQEELPLFAEGPQEQLATNTGVRLSCTMATMISLFACFLCWVEKESRVIRRFAVQSVAISAAHLLTGAVLLALGFVSGVIPYFGFLMSLLCWLVYIAVLIVLVALRIRLMASAWHGRRYDLPLLERFARKFY